jgi:hypothetical protein
VRISRAPPGDAVIGGDRRASFAGAWVLNRAAEARARRLFGLFLVVLLAIYVLFVGIAEAGSGVRSAPAAWVLFTVMAGVLAVWGWSITFGLTPRSAQRREGDVLVRERMGRVRRFPAATALTPRIVQHSDAGLLGPEPTEVVELITRERARRTYIVGEKFFEKLSGE